MAELVAYLGTGSALVFAGVAVWLALKLRGAERDRSAALQAMSDAAAQTIAMTIERDDVEAKRGNAEAALAVVRKAHRMTQNHLDAARAEARGLYAKLREAGAPGAGDMFDARIRGLRENADRDGGEEDPGTGADP